MRSSLHLLRAACGTQPKHFAPQRIRQLLEVVRTWSARCFHSSSCLGFSDAEMLGSPHARTVGVGEAPRHEVAGGGAPAVQRALWGFRSDAGVEG